MSHTKQLAQDFLNALAANNAAQFESVLHPEVGVRIWRWDGMEIYRPRRRVIDRFMREWSTWNGATLDTLNIVVDDTRAAIEFRVQATEHQQYIEHMRSAFLTIKDGRIFIIDLYCAEPQPSARRKGWIAPATCNADEVLRLFEEWQFSDDEREWISPNASVRFSPREAQWGSGQAHPGSNGAGFVHWRTEDADAKIEAMIEYHRQRNIGFRWLVNPFDTPADLRERLERHGMVLAGEEALMARVGLEHLDIPVNPAVQVEFIDGTNDESIEAGLQIVGTNFNWTKEQIDERRPQFFERAKNPQAREKELHFLARIDGVPVADARVILTMGVAYLGGASTLPAYRSRHIYSTLLRRRLEEARAHGYNVAMIHAEPMSRRVVSKYGFKSYGLAYIYAWMPVIDMAVIKSLVPDD